MPALAVPFRGSEVDFELLGEHLDRLVKSGVNGLFTVSTTGLGHAMGIRSKLELVKYVSENRKSAFVIVNVSSIEFEEIRELVKASERFGADAVSSNVMYYFRVDEEGAARFFTKIASMTELPFFIYNIPQNTGYNIEPRLVRRLKKELKNLVGVKDSSANILQIADLTTIEDLAVFNGADETTLPALIAGARGYVSALANVFPELFVELYRAYSERNYGRAVELYRKVLDVAVDLKAMSLNLSVYGALSTVYRREFALIEAFRPPTNDEREKILRAVGKYYAK
ncbi:MAG: dihydrodipicolinate synthase family protein [Sulfolobales archaeon]|nr:dihydrodipicolinate synthase family protein [Sulfolobales archaeon]MCX8209320.1 dihydrodipicolinate synthase family protein [Sulfolobales archaeon]MDW8010132.1 dihydrodipicolinate synthase family protein [Sulfolobales archaeon]